MKAGAKKVASAGNLMDVSPTWVIDMWRLRSIVKLIGIVRKKC